MAASMKLQVASVLIVAVMFALYSAHGVSCQEGESSVAKNKPSGSSTGSGAAAAAASPNKASFGGLPVVVVRQGSSKSEPNIYLGWMEWDGFSFLKPYVGQFTKPIEPISQQMSSMLLGTIPGASSVYSQFDQMGNQFSSLNPFGQIMSQLGGSSSSGSGSGSSGGSSSSGLGSLPGFGTFFQGLQGR